MRAVPSLLFCKLSHSIVLLRDPVEMAGALSLLASGFPPAEQPGYLDTLARLVSRPTAAEELVVAEARQANQRTGIALAQLLAGRAALVWPVRAVAQEVAGNLLDQVLDELRLRGGKRALKLSSKTAFSAPAGSVLRIETPGGGGWGRK